MEMMGDRAVLICFDERDNAPSDYAARIEVERLPWVVDVVPAIDTLTVVYNSINIIEETKAAEVYSYVEAALRPLFGEAIRVASRDATVIEIPVFYGGDDGPDLAACAERAGMDAAAFVAAHADAVYTAAMIGFMPGFPYLSGLSERLAQPRHSMPRQYVPAGSVGIAGMQTGIYPFASPGGWQIIGRTPLRLFDPQASDPSLLRAGCRVKFVPAATEDAGTKGEGRP